jgi:hypothetical protein
VEERTRVGRFEIPVRAAGRPTLWYFTAGAHGRKEAGVYAFWTAVLARTPRKGVTGRALVGHTPGHRFDAIRGASRSARSAADRAAYARYWRDLLKRGKAIRHIRPSTPKEVQKWMRAHEKDAPFAKPVRVPR